MNDNWPELQAFIKNGHGAIGDNVTHSKDDPPVAPVDYSVACIIAYMRHFDLYKREVLQKASGGPFGTVTTS